MYVMIVFVSFSIKMAHMACMKRLVSLILWEQLARFLITYQSDGWRKGKEMMN